jgi:hypothetical protein
MIRAYIGSFVSLAGVTVGLTWLYLGMRSVMEIGGACADGGPYVSAQPCPDGVPFLMVGGIFGGLICLGLFLMWSSRLGGSYASLAGLAWPALFLSLGWNFFDFSFDPPGEDEGPVWGWLVCGVIFALMGGVPLLYFLAPSNLMKILWPPDPDPLAVSAPRAPIGVPLGASLRVGHDPVPAPEPHDGVVDSLERLAKLRERGAIDEEEYERAKKAVLDG